MITVENPNGAHKGVQSITLNSQPIQGPIPPQSPGSVNVVVVVMA